VAQVWPICVPTRGYFPCRLPDATLNIIGSTNLWIASEGTGGYNLAWVTRDKSSSIINIEGNGNGDPNIIVKGVIRPQWLEETVATLNMSAGQLCCGAIETYFWSSLYINISGGTIHCDSTLPHNASDHRPPGNFTYTGAKDDPAKWPWFGLTMTGGLLKIDSVFEPARSADAQSRIYLDAGVIECGEFVIGDWEHPGGWETIDFLMDINEGEVRVGGNKITEMEAYRDGGKITAFDGTVPVSVTHDAIALQTVVKADRSPASMIRRPTWS
jgi:hypothetical protein